MVGRAGIRSDGSNMFIAEREGRRHAEQHGIDARHHADAVHTTKCAPATAAAAASRRIIKMMKPLLPLLCPRLRFVSVSDAACPLGLARIAVKHVSPENPWLPLLTPHQLVELDSAFRKFGALLARRRLILHAEHTRRSGRAAAAWQNGRWRRRCSARRMHTPRRAAAARSALACKYCLCARFAACVC